MTWIIARIGAEIETKLAKVDADWNLPTFDDLETAIGFPITNPNMLARWCGYRYLARPFADGYTPGFGRWPEVVDAYVFSRAERNVVLAIQLQAHGAKNQTELRAQVLKQFCFGKSTKQSTIYGRLRKTVPSLRSPSFYAYLKTLAEAGWLSSVFMRGGTGFRRTTPEERQAKREVAVLKHTEKQERAIALAVTSDLAQQLAARFGLTLTAVENSAGPGVWLSQEQLRVICETLGLGAANVPAASDDFAEKMKRIREAKALRKGSP